MNIYISAALLVLVGAASFGFGRFSAEPVYLTKTVYRDGDVTLGEYAFLSGSEFINSKIILPQDPKSITITSNFFDRTSGDSLEPLLIDPNNTNNTVFSK